VFHEKRQRGIYVSADLSDQSAPRDAISEEEAKRHIEFVEARRALETLRDWEGAGEPELERLRFFYSVLDHQHFRPFLFSAASLAKLSDLGDVPAWIDWLKEEFERFRAENLALGSGLTT